MAVFLEAYTRNSIVYLVDELDTSPSILYFKLGLEGLILRQFPYCHLMWP